MLGWLLGRKNDRHLSAPPPAKPTPQAEPDTARKPFEPVVAATRAEAVVAPAVAPAPPEAPTSDDAPPAPEAENRAARLVASPAAAADEAPRAARSSKPTAIGAAAAVLTDSRIDLAEVIGVEAGGRRVRVRVEGQCDQNYARGKDGFYRLGGAGGRRLLLAGDLERFMSGG